MVYGHLHIPRAIKLSGVHLEEVSMEYPREWKSQRARSDWLCEMLPCVPNQSFEEA